jgi:hypothetical protein
MIMTAGTSFAAVGAWTIWTAVEEMAGFLLSLADEATGLESISAMNERVRQWK